MNENENSSRDLPLANLGRRVTWNRKPQAAVCRSQQKVSNYSKRRLDILRLLSMSDGRIAELDAVTKFNKTLLKC